MITMIPNTIMKLLGSELPVYSGSGPKFSPAYSENIVR